MSTNPLEGAPTRALTWMFAVAVGLLAAGCPGTLENRGDFLACQEVPKTILGPACATSGCHDAESHAAELDLTDDEGLLGRLVDVPATASPCQSVLVSLDAPEDSLLYRRIVGSDCGAEMPPGQSLSAEDAACVLTWIELQERP